MLCSLPFRVKPQQTSSLGLLHRPPSCSTVLDQLEPILQRVFLNHFRSCPSSYSCSIERTAYISEKVNSHTFRLLNEYDVMLEGILLKPNMILPGLDAPTPSPEEVAKYTVRTMLRSVPAAVPSESLPVTLVPLVWVPG